MFGRLFHTSVMFGSASACVASLLGVGALLASAASTLGQDPPDVVWQAPAHAGGVASVAFSADGTMVASGAGGTAPDAQVRDASDGSLLHTFPGQANGVRAVDFSPAGGRGARG